ncbi:MAG: hypothetical protein RMK29_13370 [Myxococcales bacterium]|nr:hypothetical protein [Myxococcales bacterium]
MKQDYLNQVLAAARPPVGVEQLPAAQQMRAAEEEAGEIHGSLDLIRLQEAERDQLGPASRPEELELNRLYAELCDAVPQVLTLIGRPEGAMRHGYDMERALALYRQANQSLQDIARAAFVLAAAALTEDNDRAEEAALALAQDPQLPPERRAVLGNVARSLEALRATQEAAQERRRARQARRQARHEAELRLSLHREEQMRHAALLARAPLPELPPGGPR